MEGEQTWTVSTLHDNELVRWLVLAPGPVTNVSERDAHHPLVTLGVSRIRLNRQSRFAAQGFDVSFFSPRKPTDIDSAIGHYLSYPNSSLLLWGFGIAATSEPEQEIEIFTAQSNSDSPIWAIRLFTQ